LSSFAFVSVEFSNPNILLPREAASGSTLRARFDGGSVRLSVITSSLDLRLLSADRDGPASDSVIPFLPRYHRILLVVLTNTNAL
jgi:hypothetical protein